MPDTTNPLRRELDETRARLTEALEALDAIHRGEVDGLVLTGDDDQPQLYTRIGEQEPYRLLIEQMSEGALTLPQGGVILYANQLMERLLATPLERIIGAELRPFVVAADQPVLDRLLADAAARGSCRGEVVVHAAGGATAHLRLGLSSLHFGEETLVAMVVTDLTAERQQAAELLQTLKTLRKSEERLQLATRAGNIGVWDWVVVTDELTWDENFCSIYGIHKGDIKGTYEGWSSTLHPKDRAYVEGEIQATLRGEREYAPEFRIIRPDGSVRIIKAESKTIRDENNKAVRVVGTNIDITERKQRELAVNRLAAIVESSADCIIGKDLDGIITSWNHGAEIMFGYSVSEMIGTPIIRLVPEDRKDEEYQILETIRQGGSVDHFETVRQTKDGRLIDVSITVSPIKDKTGAIVGVSKVARDITERKRMETMLRQSEERFRRYFELPLIGIAITSPTKGWLEVNDRLCEMLGYSRAELLQMTWEELTDPEDLAADMAQFGHLLAGEIEGYQIEKRFMRKDGRSVPTNLVVGCVRTETGAVDYAVVLLQDISLRKEAEAVLAKAVRDLRDKNTELEHFLFAASHDLKSPVVTVRTFLGYVEEDLASGDTERLAKDMEFIRAATDKMVQLLDDVLEISRVGRLVGVPVAVTFRELVDEACSVVAGRMAGRGVTKQVVGPDMTLFGDRIQLGDIWQNLTDNACKFMGDQPAPLIEFGIQERNGEPVFYVRDNGIGIDPRYHDKIFDLFNRLDPKIEGTGMGLALVRRIVKFCGGKIWVESPGLGQGACFYFTLPSAIVKPSTGELS